MPIQIDFTVAVGIFIIIIGLSLAFVLNYLTKYSQYSKINNLKAIAYNLFVPLKLNLTTELYKLPIKITEINGNERIDTIINLSLSFDEKCEKKAWNSTVRVYEDDKEVEFSLYNQTFCEEKYLKYSDLVLKSNFSAYQTKIFFVYFSEEKEVEEPNYSIPYEENSGFKVEIFPLQETKILSIGKLKKLRNISYEDLIKNFGNYNFYLEISEK
jgi:hypothetical protein